MCQQALFSTLEDNGQTIVKENYGTFLRLIPVLPIHIYRIACLTHPELTVRIPTKI